VTTTDREPDAALLDELRAAPEGTIALGIDVGGSGMKAAPVDLVTGRMLSARFRIPTPQPAAPITMADVARRLVDQFGWRGKVGVTFPGIVRHGVVGSAVNLDPSWVHTDADAVFSAATGCDVTVLNDADAAGLAEVRFGAGANRDGVVLMVTLGTGIGTALFLDGRLVPNTELGHIEIRGKDAETRAAANVRARRNLTWAEWAQKVDEYLHRIVFLLSPDLFIIGGGVSEKADRWFSYLTVPVPVVPAALGNDAGIVGAALMGG
jgi:polyphosphate glucokinase